jgi:hypothetical protein
MDFCDCKSWVPRYSVYLKESPIRSPIHGRFEKVLTRHFNQAPPPGLSCQIDLPSTLLIFSLFRSMSLNARTCSGSPNPVSMEDRATAAVAAAATTIIIYGSEVGEGTRTDIQRGIIREKLGCDALGAEAGAAARAEEVREALLVERVRGEGRRAGRSIGPTGSPGDVLIGRIDEEVAV